MKTFHLKEMRRSVKNISKPDETQVQCDGEVRKNIYKEWNNQERYREREKQANISEEWQKNASEHHYLKMPINLWYQECVYEHTLETRFCLSSDFFGLLLLTLLSLLFV